MSCPTPPKMSIPKMHELYDYFLSGSPSQCAELLQRLKAQRSIHPLTPENLPNVLLYSQALLCAFLTTDEVDQALAYLESLTAESDSAARLCNTISSFQDTFWSVLGYLLIFHLEADLRIILDKMEGLFTAHPQNILLGGYYAELLGDLSRLPHASIEEGEIARDICERVLTSLNPNQPEPWPQNHTLANAYARVLLGLSFYTNTSSFALSSDLLTIARKLCSSFPSEHMVFLCYVKIMVNHIMDFGFSITDVHTLENAQQAFEIHSHDQIISRHFADVFVEVLTALSDDEDALQLLEPHFDRMCTAPDNINYELLAEYLAGDLRKIPTLQAHAIIKRMSQRFPTSLSLHESALDCLQMCLFSQTNVDIADTLRMLETQRENSINPFSVDRMILLTLLCAGWDEAISDSDKESYALRLAREAAHQIPSHDIATIATLYQSDSFVEAWYRLSSWLPKARTQSQGNDPSATSAQREAKNESFTSLTNPSNHPSSTEPSGDKEQLSSFKPGQIATRPSQSAPAPSVSSSFSSPDKRRDNASLSTSASSASPTEQIPSYSRLTKPEKATSTPTLPSESTHESRVPKATNAPSSPIASQKQRASLRTPVSSALQHIIELPEKPQTGKYVSFLQEAVYVADAAYKSWFEGSESNEEASNVRPLPNCSFAKAPSENSHKPH